MTPSTEQQKSLPPPWDRIFSLGSRVFVWGLLAGILYILRPFFLLVFLTFVFAYILEHGVQGLEHRIKSRALRVVAVSAVFLSTLIAAGVFLTPHFKHQATKLGKNYPEYLTKIDEALDDAREQEWVRGILPPTIKAKDIIEDLAGLVKSTKDPKGADAEAAPPPEETDEVELLDHLMGFPGGLSNLVKHASVSMRDTLDFARGRSETPPMGVIRKLAKTMADGEYTALDGAVIDESWLVKKWREERTKKNDPTPAKANLAQTLEMLKNVATPILGIGSAFLLSLLFSFLIVLDLPKLSRAVSGLAGTKVGFIYDEVAGNIHDFGKMLGRALEAQLLIALCNTFLTAIGLYFLGLTENMIFFSTIVFFCSFIPVAGVFLSSTPIALEALSVDGGGVQLMILSIVMILIIHFVEAYFLNPKIFGHHLHMNAVLVLIVLTIGGKLFGVWGLILGLPVVNYFFGHAIRRRDRPNPDAAAAA